MFTALEKYKSAKSEYIDEQLKLLNNARKFYNGKEVIINTFKNDILPFYHEKMNLRMKIKIILGMKMVLSIIRNLRN